MTAPTAAAERARPEPPRPGFGVRVLRFVGWSLITAGVVVLLYVVYALLFTNLETDAAQGELREEWARAVDGRELPQRDSPPEPESDDGSEEDVEQVEEPAAHDLGSAIAMIEFVRPGSDVRPVLDEPIFVVNGVTRDALMRGPGHYPRSALPGGDGNFAVAGHRTTYGAPFFHLDQLRAGDEIHVTDRDGTTHVYSFVEQRIVAPHDAWVLGADPLERATPLLTLTTCHPRFSARERLVVFAELAS